VSGYLYEQIARDKLGMPGARHIVIESLRIEWGDGIDATRIEVGMVPRITRGPNAGKLNYKKATDRRKLYITDAETDAWLAEHPEYCRSCGNSGERFVSWSVDEGTKTITCTACDGTERPVPFPDLDDEPAGLFGVTS